MNWREAVKAMRAGNAVRRISETYRKRIGESGGVPIFECGTEPCRLAAAWTDDERPVSIFQGTESKQLFVPDDEHRAATDWEIAP